MTLTVEPGIYFIDRLIDDSKDKETKKYLNYDIIK